MAGDSAGKARVSEGRARTRNLILTFVLGGALGFIVANRWAACEWGHLSFVCAGWCVHGIFVCACTCVCVCMCPCIIHACILRLDGCRQTRACLHACGRLPQQQCDGNACCPMRTTDSSLEITCGLELTAHRMAWQGRLCQ